MNDMTKITSGADAASVKPLSNKDRIAALEGRVDANEKYLTATAERLETFGAAVVADFDTTKKSLVAVGAMIDAHLESIHEKFGTADSNFAEVAARIQSTNEAIVVVMKDLGKKLDEDFAAMYDALNTGGQLLSDNMDKIAEKVNVVIDTVNEHSTALDHTDAAERQDEDDTPDEAAMEAQIQENLDALFGDLFDKAPEEAEAPNETPVIHEDKGVVFLTLPMLPDGENLIEALMFDEALQTIVDTAEADELLTEPHANMVRRFLAADPTIMNEAPPSVDHDLAEVMEQYSEVLTSSTVAFVAGENVSANIVQVIMTASALLAMRVIQMHMSVEE
jgi:hypothetical protein